MHSDPRGQGKVPDNIGSGLDKQFSGARLPTGDSEVDQARAQLGNPGSADDALRDGRWLGRTLEHDRTPAQNDDPIDEHLQLV